MGKHKVKYECHVDWIGIGDVDSSKRLIRDDALVSLDKKYIYFGSKGNWTLKCSDPIEISSTEDAVTFRHSSNPSKVFSCHFERSSKRMTARARTQQAESKRVLREMVSVISERIQSKTPPSDEPQSIMGMGRISSRRTLTPRTKMTMKVSPFSSSSSSRRNYSKIYGKKSKHSMSRILDRDFFHEHNHDSDTDTDTLHTHHQKQQEEEEISLPKRKANKQITRTIGKRLKKKVSNDDKSENDNSSDAEFEMLDSKTMRHTEDQVEEEPSNPSLYSEAPTKHDQSANTDEEEQDNEKNDVIPLFPQLTETAVSSVTTVTDEEEGNITSPAKPHETKKKSTIMAFFTNSKTTTADDSTKTKTTATLKTLTSTSSPPSKTNTQSVSPFSKNSHTNSTSSTDDSSHDNTDSLSDQSFSTHKKRLDLSVTDTLQNCTAALSNTTSSSTKTVSPPTSKCTSPTPNKTKTPTSRRKSLDRAAKSSVTKDTTAKRDLKTFFSAENNGDTDTSAEKKGKIAVDTVVKNPYRKIEQKSTVAGLLNLGNTCYLNSSLQIIFSVVGFLQELEESKQKRNGQDHSLPLTTALLKIAKSAGIIPSTNNSNNNNNHRTSSSVVDPKMLKKAMDRVSDKFEGYEQRDAHEFLADLLDGIHEELNQQQNYTDKKGDSSTELLPTDKYFHLNVKVCLTCDSCGYSRSKEEMYRHLSIDITNNSQTKEVQKWTVDKGLQQFFQPETLDIRCEKCKEGQSATQNMEILSCPKVLLLHLKRFIISENPIDSDKSTNNQTTSSNVTLTVRKNKEPVIFEQCLQMDKLCTSAKEYQLRGVVHHIGSSASSGHYTTDALRIDAKKEEEWITFDDCTTKSTTLSHVLNDERSQQNSYMIMYQQRE